MKDEPSIKLKNEEMEKGESVPIVKKSDDEATQEKEEEKKKEFKVKLVKIIS